jgi:streptogramin lyase
VALATLPIGSAPQGLFVDADNVYWTNAGTGEVMQIKKDGTGSTTLATQQGAPFSVFVSDGFVYWISYSGDGVMRKTAIGGGPLVDIVGAPAARELVVAGGFVFWSRDPDDIERVPIDGLPDGGMTTLLSMNNLANGVTADVDTLYWVTRQDGNVKKADFMLGNDQVLAIGDQPWDIAVDAGSVYWTERGSGAGVGKVMKVAKTGGAPTVLASMQDGPRGIAIDGSHVYWVNQEEGTVRRVPLGGGAVELVASQQEKPVNVAVDGTHVYWANSAGDTVMKVAK